MTTEVISPSRLEEIRRSGRQVDLIDVRTPVEFREVHAESARNLPLDQIAVRDVMDLRAGVTNEPLYVICRSGSRAEKACQHYLDVGFVNVVNVSGGTEAWEAAGLPVVRGRPAISLERQVRIAAGLLVLLGLLLGWVVHPYFVGLSAVVGAGLMFAGITDTCGLGMLLARMPWNQVGRTESSAPACSQDVESTTADANATGYIG